MNAICGKHTVRSNIWLAYAVIIATLFASISSLARVEDAWLLREYVCCVLAPSIEGNLVSTNNPIVCVTNWNDALLISVGLANADVSVRLETDYFIAWIKWHDARYQTATSAFDMVRHVTKGVLSQAYYLTGTNTGYYDCSFTDLLPSRPASNVFACSYSRGGWEQTMTGMDILGTERNLMMVMQRVKAHTYHMPPSEGLLAADRGLATNVVPELASVFTNLPEELQNACFWPLSTLPVRAATNQVPALLPHVASLLNSNIASALEGGSPTPLALSNWIEGTTGLLLTLSNGTIRIREERDFMVLLYQSTTTLPLMDTNALSLCARYTAELLSERLGITKTNFVSSAYDSDAEHAFRMAEYPQWTQGAGTKCSYYRLRHEGLDWQNIEIVDALIYSNSVAIALRKLTPRVMATPDLYVYAGLTASAAGRASNRVFRTNAPASLSKELLNACMW